MLIINFIKQIYILLQNQNDIIQYGIYSKKKLNFSLKMQIISSGFLSVSDNV